ncbi:hypothetical protein ACFPL7_05620 [Dongia soli]|uniref:Uncharacterized protein n=1 Tax=Dongia soli TaxID=600628 RepID=A0ABU5EER5_9PROT|nr:hypothetical protein [Dongia soli]MDY0884879.1 hypothetical protein [Dongia soli]
MTTQNEPGKQGRDAQARESGTAERAFAKDEDDSSRKNSRTKPMSQAERSRRDPLIDTPDNAARSNRPGVDRQVGDRAGRIGPDTGRSRERAANPGFDDAGSADDTRKAADILSGARNREG